MAGKKSYKKLLLVARSLRGDSGINAHCRIGILVEVFEDQDFRVDIGGTDDSAFSDVLDAEVEDLCVTFLQLRAIYRAFPAVADWEDGKLKTLYNRTVEIAEADKPERTKRSVVRVTNQQYKQLEFEKQDVVAQLNYSKEMLDETKSDMGRLRDENRELRNDNMRLEGRIEELKKLITPQHAMMMNRTY